jgi:hypothetical protein
MISIQTVKRIAGADPRKAGRRASQRSHRQHERRTPLLPSEPLRLSRCCPPDTKRQNTQTTIGARYNGPIPARLQDGIGFAFIYSRIADPYRAIGIPPGLPLLGSEKAIELNYAANIRPYLLFQPVFQYYDDVGANSHIPNAAVFGFRVKVDI